MRKKNINDMRLEEIYIKIAGEVADTMCENYCKYHDKKASEKEICNNCPLLRL